MAHDALAKEIEELIAGRRALETGDIAVELRDHLWLAQFLPTLRAAEVPAPPAAAPAPTPPPGAPPESKTLPPPVPEPNTPPPTPPKPVNDEPSGLMQGAQTTAGGETRKASRVRTPSAAALPDALAIERALRPFRKRKPSTHTVVIDEEETVQELAAARAAGLRLAMPKFRPAPERWFHVALITDAGTEMALWRRTIADFRKLLGRQGAFSDVRHSRLVPAGGRLQLENDAGVRLPLRSLIDPAGRQIVLLLTQGTGEHWSDETWITELEHVASKNPVGIVQLLPAELWPHTRLGPPRREATARRPGECNARLRLAKSWLDLLGPGPQPLPFPVLTLEPNSISQWARTLTARRGGLVPCVLLGTAMPPEEIEEEDPGPVARIEQFRGLTAGGPAFDLLRHLAAVPLTLPVMRIVRQAMVPEASLADLGAILVSGLLRIEGPSADPEQTYFDFLPGVREELLALLRMGEGRRTQTSVKDEIRRFLETQSGRALPEDISYVFDEQGDVDLPASAQAFVEVNRRMLEQLGLRKAPILKAEATSTKWGIQMAGDVANPLYAVLERSFAAHGFHFGPGPESVLITVDSAGSGTIVSVAPPGHGGAPFDFSNSRKWLEVYRELIAYIERCGDQSPVSFGVPPLPHPYMERPAIEAALRYRLTEKPGARINLTSSSFVSGKSSVLNAVVRHPMTARRFPGGIYWQCDADPGRSGPRLFVSPSPETRLAPEDAAVWFDDPDNGDPFEVEALTRVEADTYFLAIGGEPIREALSALWFYTNGRQDNAAWLGVALREFPHLAHDLPRDGEAYFPWLFEAMPQEREGFVALAAFEGDAPVPEELVAAVIPDEGRRAHLYELARKLCLFKDADPGWWRLRSAARQFLTAGQGMTPYHCAIVDYYDSRPDHSHWDQPYFRRCFPSHCEKAGNLAALERLYNRVQYLHLQIQNHGWEHLAAELRSHGFHELGGKLERAAPKHNVSLEDLCRMLEDRAEVRIFVDQSVTPGRLPPFRDSSLRIVHDKESAEIFLWSLDRRSGESRPEPVPGQIVINFELNEASEIESIVQRIARDLRGSLLVGVPKLPEPYLVRTELLRKFLVLSRERVAITGMAGSGRKTLAAAVARMPIHRQEFTGGIYWGPVPLADRSGPRLFVVDLEAGHPFPELRKEDRLICIGAPAETFTVETVDVPKLPASEPIDTPGLHVAVEEGADLSPPVREFLQNCGAAFYAVYEFTPSQDADKFDLLVVNRIFAHGSAFQRFVPLQADDLAGVRQAVDAIVWRMLERVPSPVQMRDPRYDRRRPGYEAFAQEPSQEYVKDLVDALGDFLLGLPVKDSAPAILTALESALAAGLDLPLATDQYLLRVKENVEGESRQRIERRLLPWLEAMEHDQGALPALEQPDMDRLLASNSAKARRVAYRWLAENELDGAATKVLAHKEDFDSELRPFVLAALMKQPRLTLDDFRQLAELHRDFGLDAVAPVLKKYRDVALLCGHQRSPLLAGRLGLDSTLAGDTARTQAIETLTHAWRPIGEAMFLGRLLPNAHSHWRQIAANAGYPPPRMVPLPVWSHQQLEAARGRPLPERQHVVRIQLDASHHVRHLEGAIASPVRYLSVRNRQVFYLSEMGHEGTITGNVQANVASRRLVVADSPSGIRASLDEKGVIRFDSAHSEYRRETVLGSSMPIESLRWGFARGQECLAAFNSETTFLCYPGDGEAEELDFDRLGTIDVAWGGKWAELFDTGHVALSEDVRNRREISLRTRLENPFAIVATYGNIGVASLHEVYALTPDRKITEWRWKIEDTIYAVVASRRTPFKLWAGTHAGAIFEFTPGEQPNLLTYLPGPITALTLGDDDALYAATSGV
ncbi:MAG: hypothetical protein FJW30_03980 [Acidobacteria bacterium]|nr:hypothetical protein [Acidobacteriota bacterium]